MSCLKTHFAPNEREMHQNFRFIKCLKYESKKIKENKPVSEDKTLIILAKHVLDLTIEVMMGFSRIDDKTEIQFQI